MDCKRFLQNMVIFVLLISGMTILLCSGKNRPMTPEAHPKTEEMAMALFKARTIPERIPPLADMYGALSIDQAYLVQDRLAEKMSEVLGFVNGYKIGYASESVFAELNISEPALGSLFEHTII